MKNLKTLSFSLFLIFCLSFLTFTQTEQTKSSTKIGLIHKEDFNNKLNGIKEVTDAYDKLEIEFKPQAEMLSVTAEKLQKLEKFITKMNDRAKLDPPSEKIAENLHEFEKSLNEYELLACKFKSEQQTAQSQFEKREAEILTDINIKIVEALKQFGKQNGFTIILEKTDQNSSVIVDRETVDITQNFIQYYNQNFVENIKQ